MLQDARHDDVISGISRAIFMPDHDASFSDGAASTDRRAPHHGSSLRYFTISPTPQNFSLSTAARSRLYRSATPLARILSNAAADNDSCTLFQSARRNARDMFLQPFRHADFCSLIRDRFGDLRSISVLLQIADFLFSFDVFGGVAWKCAPGCVFVRRAALRSNFELCYFDGFTASRCFGYRAQADTRLRQFR